MPIKLLFIDASHTYGDVKRDYLKFEPFVSKGGLIAMHDCFPIHLPMFYLDVWKGKQDFWQGPDFEGGPQRLVEEYFNYDNFSALGKIQALTYGVKKY